MALIDLTTLIRPHWRWPVKIEQVMTLENGDSYRVTRLGAAMHSFTHVDTPLHIEPGRETIEEVPLDALCGAAAVVDLSPARPNQEIGLEQVQAAWGRVREGDVVLLKTCWDQQRDMDTKEYWTEAPWLSREAAAWLARQPIKALGFDFPQDHAIRQVPGRHPRADEMPTHDLVLRKGIYLIEYLCNLGALKADRVELFVMPLKVQGAEGACARVAAKMD